MRSLLLIIGLVTIFRLEARPIKKTRPVDGQENVHFVLYRVKTDPKIDLLQIPSEERIILENISESKIQIYPENFNGTPIYAPINLDYSMTKKEICIALHESFRVNNIRWFQGVMSRSTYLEIFPPEYLGKTIN